MRFNLSWLALASGELSLEENEMKKRFRKNFVWATAEQACGEPLYWYQRLFRFILNE